MPTLADYDHAFSRGSRATPIVRRLGDGKTALLESGLPRRVVGSDAVVYRFDLALGGAIAVRCFLTSKISVRTEQVYRQAASPALFRRLRSPDHSPLVQRLAWIEDAVLLAGPDLHAEGIPAVAMEWIAGPTLFQAVDVATRKDQGALLGSVAQQWSDAMTSLREVGFAHGSLSPTNALLERERGVVLVDYDTAWWPGMATLTGEATPFGYRHPRGVPAAPERRDEFAALVIYVSLRALSVHPELRSTYGGAVGVIDPPLLFDQHDIDEPGRSRLFDTLHHSSDREVSALTAILREAAESSPEDVPFIRDAQIAAKRVAVTTAARIKRDSPSPEPLPDQSRLIFAALPPPTPELESRREELALALRSRSSNRVMQLWPDLADDPGSSRYAIDANEIIESACLAMMEEVSDSADAALIEQRIDLARCHGVPVPVEIQRALRAAKKPKRLSGSPDRAIANRDIAHLAGVAALSRFEGNPTVDPMSELAFDLVLLRDAIKSGDDRRIMQQANPRLLATVDPLPPSVANRVDLARKRLAWKTEVRSALKARDYDHLVELTAHAPDGGMAQLTPVEQRRIDRAINQRRAIANLRKAMAGQDDRALIDAMNEVERVGALMPAELEWSSLRALVDRLSLISSIRRAARDEPPDYERLGRLLPAARSLFGAEEPYLGPDIDIESLELMVQKASHRRRLVDALERGDDVALAHAAYPDPFQVVATLPSDQRHKIEDLLDRLRRIDPLKPQ